MAFKVRGNPVMDLLHNQSGDIPTYFQFNVQDDNQFVSIKETSRFRIEDEFNRRRA